MKSLWKNVIFHYGIGASCPLQGHERESMFNPWLLFISPLIAQLCSCDHTMHLAKQTFWVWNVWCINLQKRNFKTFFFFNIKKNIFQGVRALNHTAFLTPLEFPKISHPLFKKFSSAWTQTCEQLTIRVVFILNTSGKDYMIRFMCNNN